MRHLFVIIASASLMLAASPLRAQNSIVDVQLGWPSDRAFTAIPSTYEVIDTVLSFTGTQIIRMVPVPLAGINGVLVLHIDSTDTVRELYWTRVNNGRYT